MQNAPAMLAQKMMNRQAAYAPVGMVSQNMSGNKKGGASGPSGPVIGLKFDTTTATAGVTFSNSNTTAINSTGGNIASAKANAGTITGAAVSWYWEFTLNSLSILIGIGPSSFVCNSTNQVGITTGTISYDPSAGIIYINGSIAANVATARIGDVVGFKLTISVSTSSLTTYVNNVFLNTSNTTSIFPNYNTVLFPIYSSIVSNASATISNNIYEQGGTIPIGTSVTTVAASASVPAVADGAYDVYTFNASGTFTASSTGGVRALVIAGGGAGGQTYGAGGAGGYLENGAIVTPQTYTITVGAGGAGQAFTGNSQSLVSNNGNNSAFSTITATGGGGGGAYSDTTATVARVGGSGGGGSLILSGNVAGAAGIAGQGFAGGNASGSPPNYGGGGGGGAAATGSAGTTTAGGNGGAGKTSTITGVSVTRAGGGGGSFLASGGTIGTGGAGGGGDGASTGTDAAGVGVAGTANTGGGGGGSHSVGNTSTSASGGSGVVIIRVRARA